MCCNFFLKNKKIRSCSICKKEGHNKSNKKFHPQENLLVKSKKIIKCSICKKEGHNKRTCHVQTIKNLLDIITLTKKPKKGRDVNSFSYLIDREITQSEAIRLGSAMESSMNQITEKMSKHKNIKEKNKKGKKETDILFKDSNVNITWYFELKSNINLDTEKAPATAEKIKKIKKDNNYNGGLLCLRWLSRNDIPKILRNKFINLDDEEIYGINDYFEVLGIDYKFSNYDEYKQFVNGVMDKIIL